MGRVVISEETCKGCEACVPVCPAKILKLGENLNAGGYHPVTCIDESKCTGCASCYRVCPDVVFEVYR
ncbi:MAG TPA: 4Fe-4S binding protein [Candidatus Wallbacteria bacterium]|nr:4Fe-4S binding protein [Candidatus Wallbacteria bacterium]